MRGPAATALALQRSAGNRAVTQVLARGPTKVPGGVETTVVSPAVRQLLESKSIEYAREVEFQLLAADGTPVLKGKFDIVFRHPATGQLVFPELKGDQLDALTKGQKVYVPLFESKDGAQVRITSHKGGKLLLPTGHVERVHGESFFRVGSANLKDFTAYVEEAATGKRPTNVYYDRGKLLAFHDQAEFDKFLAERGIPTTKTPQAKVPASDKPLRPPAPTDKPSPNPLHDPPKPRPGWDPTAGPPSTPARKGPLHKPQPHDVDRPAKPRPTVDTSPPKPAPADPHVKAPDATVPKTGQIPGEHVTIAYDTSEAHPQVRVKSIDLRDYPPDRPGPVVGFFKDRPVLGQLATIGANVAASTAADKMLELVQDHFTDAVQDARKQFARLYPTAAQLREDFQIADRKHDYDEVMNGKKASLQRGFDQNLVRLFAYEEALLGLLDEIEHDRGRLDDLLADLRKRSQAITRMAQEVESAFAWLHTHFITVFEYAYYQSFALWQARGTLLAVAASLDALINDIATNDLERNKLYDKTEAEYEAVADELDKWRPIYEGKVPAPR